MPHSRVLLFILLFLAAPSLAKSSTFLEVSFGAGISAPSSISEPQSGLVQTASGTFYGVANAGGTNNGGAIYSYTLGGVVTLVFNFSSSGSASTTYGNSPYGGMVLASNGNIYGTTTAGGANGSGTLFSYTPGGTVTTLASLSSATGTSVYGPLIQGSDGNIYGTAYAGGSNSQGTVFKYVIGGSLSALASFGVSPDNGNGPWCGLLEVSPGTFYGTTLGGGANSDGEIFSITSTGTLTTLANFTATTGSNPSCTLVMAANGTIYGSAGDDGSGSSGTIFSYSIGLVTPIANFNGTNGEAPAGNLIQAPDGSFYGTTFAGGNYTDGNLFNVTPSGTVTNVVTFIGSNGMYPNGNLCQGMDGCLYGTVSEDSNGSGGIFRYNPSATESVALNSASTVPLVVNSISISGSALAVTLNYAPSPGAVLTVIDCTGSTAISGKFSNLPNNGTISAVYNGVIYKFKATYSTFTLKLTLTSSTTGTAPAITSANNATFTVGQAGSFQVTATGSPTPTFSATGLPSWATLNPTTGLLTGTPPNGAGPPFAIQITASNGVNPAATQNFTLTVSQTFAQWVTQYGVTGGQTGTPLNDGVPNLLKFLYDINPTTPMAATDRAAEATAGTTTISSTNYLTLTWRQNAALTGVTVTPQMTSNLQTWSTAPAPTQVGTDPNTGDPIMQVQVPYSGNEEFLQLNVTSP